jgi:hypothetical protein
MEKIYKINKSNIYTYTFVSLIAKHDVTGKQIFPEMLNKRQRCAVVNLENIFGKVYRRLL